MKQKKRKIIWFNPPYSVNGKTNIGEIFLSLLKKHFPKKNKLHKIFDKNNAKSSFSITNRYSNATSPNIDATVE